MGSKDIFTQEPLNTAERAMNLLAHEYTTSTEGETVKVLRTGAPAGSLSDGTRAFSIGLCERHRWLVVSLGWDTIAEFDQREMWEQPGRMAEAAMNAIDKKASAMAGELAP